VSLALWRALLAPLTSLRALLILIRSRPTLAYDTAWRRARMLSRPDEMVYRLHGHSPPGDAALRPSRCDDTA
jgi:hypothetical protein